MGLFELFFISYILQNKLATQIRMSDQTEVKLPPIASAAPIANEAERPEDKTELNNVASDKATIELDEKAGAAQAADAP